MQHVHDAAYYYSPVTTIKIRAPVIEEYGIIMKRRVKNKSVITDLRVALNTAMF